MLALVYKKSAAKALIRIPTKIARKIRDELTAIAANPDGYRGDWKPLAGTDFSRLRVGGYRAICAIRDQELVLLVLKVGARGDVYK